MRTLLDRAPGRAAAALVLLPAARARPEDFMAHGFVDAVRSRGLALDLVLPDAHADLYLDDAIAERLESEVMAPLRAEGYGALWLAGISLGGMGSIAYACRHRGGAHGVLLLAPFLGLPAENREPELLGELSQGPMPEIFLGYGAQDRYARASALLARRLHADRVTTLDGGHDWPTWRRLWDAMLGQAFPS
jgi:hypothetical protein